MVNPHFPLHFNLHCRLSTCIGKLIANAGDQGCFSLVTWCFKFRRHMSVQGMSAASISKYYERCCKCAGHELRVKCCRVGAPRFLGSILIVWGLVATLFAWMQTSAQFYTLRLILGLAESGAYPGATSSFYDGLFMMEIQSCNTSQADIIKTFFGRLTSKLVVGCCLASAGGFPLDEQRPLLFPKKTP